MPVPPPHADMLQRLMAKMEAAESMREQILASSEKTQVCYISIKMYTRVEV